MSSKYFHCQNGQTISWSSVCDGQKQCFDGSDEQNCYCQGDVYTCIHGNNVSCRLACTTFRRVTCLHYQNTIACEQYNRERIAATANQFDFQTASDSALSANGFDALRYSAFLAGGILLFVSLISMIVYLCRKHPSQLLFFCPNRLLCHKSHRKSTNRLTSESSVFQQQSEIPSSPNLSRNRYVPAPDVHDLPPSYYADRNHIALGDCYEPPPYPGPPSFAPVQRSDSVYYETIKNMSTTNSMSMLNTMPLPEPRAYTNARTHRV